MHLSESKQFICWFGKLLITRKCDPHSEQQTVPISDTSMPRICLQHMDLQLKRDIERLENVKKFGVHACIKQCHCRYGNLLELNIVPTLAVRRKFLKLCQFYSMVNGLATLPQYIELLHMLTVFSLSITPPWFNLWHTQTCIQTFFPLLPFGFGITYWGIFVVLLFYLLLSMLY